MIRPVEKVLGEIPGWEDATYSELPGGLSNDTFLVEADGRRAVLKIDANSRQAPYNSRRAEAQIQMSAADNGLASPVLYVSDTVYMTEYLEGNVWRISCLEEDANLESLAKTLRRLHALPLTGRTFDAQAAARSYADKIENADPELLRRSLRVVDAMPAPFNLCCCHNDLVAGNIIATPGIRFLDWEYACDNDPFFDLATVVAHHELSADRAELLLDVYFDGDGKRWRERLGMYRRFYIALLWLWHAARSSSPTISQLPQL